MPDDPVSDGQGGDDPPVAGPSTTRPPMTSTESSQHVPSSSDIEAMLDSRRKTRKFRDMMFGKRTAAKSQFDTYRAERLSTGSTEGDPVLDEEEAGPLPSSRDETSQPHPGIEITESGREASNEEYDGDPMSHLDIPDKGIFVWDVLFENQRGIFLLGKGYFSSRTLLPADPSPFTVPSHSLPSASSITVGQANPDPQEPNMEHSRQSPTAVQAGTVYQSGTRNASDTRDTEPKAGTEGVKDRPIETGYTLETFQTPSPAWSWITPWMINMRTGADESGWRYNGWFRKKGWKSHAGPAGFNGWVRRREWVRLRGILPPKEDSDSLLEMENEKYKEKEDEKGEVGDKYEAKSLKEVLGGEEDEADEVLLKLMGQIPLDRERLHRWEAWLDKSDEEDKRVLTEYIATPESSHDLARCFVHPSGLADLMLMLASHGFEVPGRQEDSPESSRVSSRVSSPPSPDTPPATTPPLRTSDSDTITPYDEAKATKLHVAEDAMKPPSPPAPAGTPSTSPALYNDD